MTSAHPNLRLDSPGTRTLRAISAAGLMVFVGLLSSAAGTEPAAAQSPAPALACSSALDSLVSDWRSIGFAEPVKPAQAIVAGRGHTATSGQYNYMVQQIRLSARDCQAGRNEAALQHIDTVRGILAHTSRS
jgi:hypothetical protein